MNRCAPPSATVPAAIVTSASAASRNGMSPYLAWLYSYGIPLNIFLVLLQVPSCYWGERRDGSVSYRAQAECCDCCWGTRDSQALDCHSYHWGKDPSSPLAGGASSPLHLPSAQRCPADQHAFRLPGCCLSATARRSLAASPWLPRAGSLPEPPWAPRKCKGHSSPSTCCKGFNPVRGRVRRDQSMQ